LCSKNNIPFTEAVTKLAGICGISLNEDSQLAYLRSRWLKKPEEIKAKTDKLLVSQRIYQLNRFACDVFKKYFEGSLASQYLTKRGFDKPSMDEFELGYYPSTFMAKANAAGFTDEELKSAGFLTDYGERFSFRLMFPIYTADKNIIAFSGRALEEAQEPKYTATSNSEYYKKSFFLYGLNRVRHNEPILLVEGNLDCIRLHRYGYNALAQLGTALTAEQCRLLKTLTNNIILITDGDEAGRHSMHASILPLVSEGLWISTFALPDGYDPDLYIKEFSANELGTGLKTNTKDGLLYYLNSKFNIGKGPLRILTECLKALSVTSDPDIKERYVQRCSELFHFSKESIYTEMKKV
jgi:DNA primase